jgi:hypothetical protein
MSLVFGTFVAEILLLLFCFASTNVVAWLLPKVVLTCKLGDKWTSLLVVVFGPAKTKD